MDVSSFEAFLERVTPEVHASLQMGRARVYAHVLNGEREADGTESLKSRITGAHLDETFTTVIEEELRRHE